MSDFDPSVYISWYPANFTSAQCSEFAEVHCWWCGFLGVLGEGSVYVWSTLSIFWDSALLSGVREFWLDDEFR